MKRHSSVTLESPENIAKLDVDKAFSKDDDDEFRLLCCLL